MKIADDHISSRLRTFLAKATAGTFGIKVANLFLAYGTSLLLARSLKAEGYGAYVYALAWMNLLAIPATLGLEGLVTREVAAYSAGARWGLVKGLLSFANRFVFWNALVIALIAGTIFYLLGQTDNSSALLTACIGVIAIPLMSLARLRQSALQASQHILAGQLLEMLIRPGLLLVLIGVAYILTDSPLSPYIAIAGYVLASSGAFWVGSRLLQQKLMNSLSEVIPEYQPRIWLKSAMPMLFIGSMYVVNNQTDAVMLGILQDAKSVGIYTVANRGASLIGFVLLAFNTSLGPTFTTLHQSQQMAQLQKLVKTSCRLVFGAALFTSVGLIVSGNWFLFLFGPEFVAGRTVLNILAIGQLANAFMGSVAMLLIMTGFARDTAIGVAVSAFINIGLNVLLIPRYGMAGAAIATSSSMAIWNAILYVFAYRRLGIRCHPL